MFTYMIKPKNEDWIDKWDEKDFVKKITKHFKDLGIEVLSIYFFGGYHLNGNKPKKDSDIDVLVVIDNGNPDDKIKGGLAKWFEELREKERFKYDAYIDLNIEPIWYLEANDLTNFLIVALTKSKEVVVNKNKTLEKIRKIITDKNVDIVYYPNRKWITTKITMGGKNG